MRRLAVTNHSDRAARDRGHELRRDRARRRPADDLAHPAFGKLFVETEYLPESAALLCRRRPRAPDDAGAVGGARAEPRGPHAGPARVGDRPRALPRPRARPDDPQALDGRPLSGTTGVGARPDRQPAAAHPARRRAASCGCPSPPAWPRAARRPLALAAEVPRPERRGAHLRAGLRARAERACATSASPATRRMLFERLASRVLYADGSLRAGPDDAGAATRSARQGSGPHGISGDLPILLVRVVEDGRPAARAPGAAGAGVLAAQGPAAPTSSS